MVDGYRRLSRALYMHTFTDILAMTRPILHLVISPPLLASMYGGFI